MSDHQYLPISYLDESRLLPLMQEEEKAWMSDLCWDYSPIRQILVSFIKQKLLPGYAAVSDRGAIGYTYFLVNHAKGIIGSLYVSRTGHAQEAVEELLALTISSLKDSQSIKRVEAQIMPFNNLNLTATFTQHGFSYYPRYYLDLDLGSHRKKIDSPSPEKIIPWSSSYLEGAAEMSLISYRDQTDAEICEDYRTKAGCEGYLRSLVENPGCGIFMPETSFMALDPHGSPCGFLICSRISEGAGMIPQIAVHPSYQGGGIGNALMNRSFEQLKSMGLRSVGLTVTKKNRRAFDWYQRLGFKIRKEFGAYVWQK
jgi:ribosomal protein S18 acetylase RimI-like enzyme